MTSHPPSGDMLYSMSAALHPSHHLPFSILPGPVGSPPSLTVPYLAPSQGVPVCHALRSICICIVDGSYSVSDELYRRSRMGLEEIYGGHVPILFLFSYGLRLLEHVFFLKSRLCVGSTSSQVVVMMTYLRRVSAEGERGGVRRRSQASGRTERTRGDVKRISGTRR